MRRGFDFTAARAAASFLDILARLGEVPYAAAEPPIGRS
jgi:hypothetical protein